MDISSFYLLLGIRGFLFNFPVPWDLAEISKDRFNFSFGISFPFSSYSGFEDFLTAWLYETEDCFNWFFPILILDSRISLIRSGKFYCKWVMEGSFRIAWIFFFFFGLFFVPIPDSRVFNPLVLWNFTANEIFYQSFNSTVVLGGKNIRIV